MLDVMAAVERWGSGTIPVQVAAGRCVRQRSRRATCDRCQTACPVGAVSLGRQPEIAESCTGCGLCVAACPVEALQLERPTPGQVLAAAREQAGQQQPAGPLAFVCERAAARLAAKRGGRAVVVVPCVGWLTPELLVAVHAETRRPLVLHQGGACASCKTPAGAARVVETAGAVNRLLGPNSSDDTSDKGVSDEIVRVGDAALLAPRPADSIQEPAAASPGRRAFLSRLTRGTATRHATSTPLGPDRPGTPSLATFVSDLDDPAPEHPIRPGLLAQALAILGPAPDAPLPRRQLGAGPACTFCPACSTLCPAGALRVLAAGPTVALTWSAAACLDCGLCRDACPLHALSADAPLPAAAVLDPADRPLIAGTAARCACGTAYWQAAGGPALCPACRLRQQSR